MHLLRTQPGGFVSDDNIADLGQTPAELVILCSGDSSLALLAEAAQQLPEDYPSLRLANPMQVQNHASVDLYVDEVLRHAKVILISLHGGIAYWRYGVERLVELAERGVQVILVPGDDRPDPELSDLSTVLPRIETGSGSTCVRAACTTRWIFSAAWPDRWLAVITSGKNRKPCRVRRFTTRERPPPHWATGKPNGCRSSGGGGFVLPLAFASGEHRRSSMFSASACWPKG
jgi:cobaltochelatase CobN